MIYFKPYSPGIPESIVWFRKHVASGERTASHGWGFAAHNSLLRIIPGAGWQQHGVLWGFHACTRETSEAFSPAGDSRLVWIASAYGETSRRSPHTVRLGPPACTDSWCEIPNRPTNVAICDLPSVE